MSASSSTSRFETTEPSSLPMNATRISTGIAGLDEILLGGFVAHRLYLVTGEPGTGKTTMGLQFLLEGAARGERVLYVTLSESRAELAEVARSHGWSLERAEIFELAPTQQADPDEQYTLFHPAEVELAETTRAILDMVERTQPARVVFDSLSEMRLLARDSLRFRRQILALKQYFANRQVTVLMLDDSVTASGDVHPQTIAHGVITLEQRPLEYGADRRRLRVNKLRGVPFREGHHDYQIRHGGLRVYPRLVPARDVPLRDATPVVARHLKSGVPALDALLGGGAELGSSMLLMGPAGVGKSAFAVHYCCAAALAGQRACLLLFDESPVTMFTRSRSLGIEVEREVHEGRILVDPMDPAEISPGQLSAIVKERVEHDGVSVVVVDSLNGYLNAMPQERHVLVHFHELLGYLGGRDVLTMMIVAQHGMLGHMESPVDLSYLADTVVLMRYFESAGAVHQAVSVVKKRRGRHERTIREFRLGPGGVSVGEPLRQFHGVLTGVPSYTGAPLTDGER